MRLSAPTLLRLAALVLLVAFIAQPQWFEPVFKPLTENNAPAIYNQGNLLSLTLLHLRTVAFATVAAYLVGVAWLPRATWHMVRAELPHALPMRVPDSHTHSLPPTT